MHGLNRTPKFLAAVTLMVSCALAAAQAPTQPTTSTGPQAPTPSAEIVAGKLGPSAPVTYDNRYEVFGGLNYMNFQAGQSLAKLMNLGGAEVQGTVWLTDRFGAMLDGRAAAGTTQVISPYYNRVVVYQEIGMAGVAMRGPKNQHAAIDLHALFGVSHGVFDNAVQNYPGGSPVGACKGPNNLGLYCNTVKPMGTVGASFDLNQSKHFAVRLSPELVLEHFGTETREFFSISGGIVYRIGKR